MTKTTSWLQKAGFSTEKEYYNFLQSKGLKEAELESPLPNGEFGKATIMVLGQGALVLVEPI